VASTQVVKHEERGCVVIILFAIFVVMGEVVFVRVG